MRRRLERARVVALPVRENSYSGATTVLLQAMALGKPVVVTRTAAIATGYGLEDGDNVRLVAPGDAHGLRARARRRCSATSGTRRALGVRARATVESELTWDRYVDRLAAWWLPLADELREVSAASAGGQPDGRSHDG